ncbi:Alpha/Beta hydrolase protein [Pisolithus orientalis]|uniref:Alpha/Beta hydrolase protein n=1 Tax=Pisolithus orientalis TaxID=936130 RepID=UPI00222512F0|nr:Alpha/Beta hydrolase protein [Pisolithus orientalis]KAI6015280.1 Alpha/Beta hydrolase protein [Pisolithus orientalis]
MTRMTFSIPYTPSPSWPSVNPRPLLAIRPHPALRTPSLPSPPRQDIFHKDYVPKYTHYIPLPLLEIPPRSDSISPAERQEKVATAVKQLIERQECFTQGTMPGGHGQKPLWNCVNRYVRTDRCNTAGTGLTLFVAHANGFPKEISETMLRGLLDSPAAPLVDEIWSWEAVQHGDSALLNAENLSGIFDWQDNARDIANFLLHYLPDEAAQTPLPTRLLRISQAVSDARKAQGYHQRKIVVVGHSFGGTTSALAAVNFPKLFSSLILVDPVVVNYGSYDFGSELIRGALIRRDTWSSREEALRLFKQRPFFASWHPDVLKSYVDYWLKMTPIQESLCFANVFPPLEVWELLEKLDEDITLRWVVPAVSFVGEQETKVRVWRRPANASNVVFPFAGHLIVQEAPVELARDISTFLLEKYGTPHFKAAL